MYVLNNTQLRYRICVDSGTLLYFRLENISCDCRYIVSAVAKVMLVSDSLQTLR